MAIATAAAAVSSSVPAHGRDRDSLASPEKEISGEVSVSRVFAADLAASQAEEDDNGSSRVLRGSLDYDLDFGATDVAIGYDTAAFFYDEDSQSNRWSNRASAGAGTPISDELQLFGQVSYGSNITTAESGSTDQVEVLGRLQISLSDESRVRAFAGYRWRDYDADGTSGRGAFAGAEYRYRFAANHYLTIDARYETIESDALRRGYERTTAAVFYQTPLAEDLRVSGGVSARWWDFDTRFAPDGHRLRRRSYTPELELQYAARTGFLLRALFQYIVRESNDPRFAEDQGRAVVTGGYRF
jgi:hypothetical protein